MKEKFFLKFDGTNRITGDLNLNNNKILHLETDEKNQQSAVNVDLMTKKFMNHISLPHHKKTFLDI